MGENVGSDVESEFGSVTSSQIYFLNNCPFADPTKSLAGVDDTDSNGTEVLATPLSQPVTHTRILSLSTPKSLDSINDEDVFRTPPENASLSSAAESEPRVRVPEIKPRGGGGSTTTRVSASASLTRVLETNRIADSEGPVRAVTPLISPPSSLAAGNGEVPRGGSRLRSPSPVSASPSIPAETVRVLEMNRLSKSPSPGKQSDLDSSSQSVTEGINVSESGGDDDETEIPFKEVMEALLRNNGENLGERDERVSYVDILKECGLKFP